MRIETIRSASCAAFFSTIFGIVAGFQVLGISRDYKNYLEYFDFIRGISIYEALAHRFEPGFAILAQQLSNLNFSDAAIYTAIAGTCMLIKIHALEKEKNYWVVLPIFLIIYLSRYFTLFELTVLRATVALSLAFFVFLRRETKKNRVSEIAILLIAISMHYSAAIFLPIYLFTPNSRSKTIISAFAVFITIILLKSIALDILPEYFIAIKTYENTTDTSLIPKPMLIDIVFLCFMLYNWNNDDFQMKTSTYAVLISLVLHFSFFDQPIFAARFRELLSIFFLIYIVRAINQKNNITKFAAVLFSITSSTIHIYSTYIYDPLLT